MQARVSSPDVLDHMAFTSDSDSDMSTFSSSSFEHFVDPVYSVAHPSTFTSRSGIPNLFTQPVPSQNTTTRQMALSLSAEQSQCNIVLSKDQAQSTPSTLYGIIPNVVRSRIPVLSSIRQSARNAVSRPPIQSRPLSIPDIKRIVQQQSSGSSSRRDSISSESTVPSGTITPSTLPYRPPTPEDLHQALIPAERQVAPSNIQTGGVDWDVAGAGVKLWLNARAQAQLGAGDINTLRSMHIDALRYMNMALSSAELSTTEVESLRSSLPAQLRGSDTPQPQITNTRPNALRQGVAQVVCWLIAMILVLIPLLMTTINNMIVYEREHKLLERAVNGSAGFTKAMGERGLDVGDALIRFKSTPLGKACMSALSWTVEGIAGGVNDGLMQSTNGRLMFADGRQRLKST